MTKISARIAALLALSATPQMALAQATPCLTQAEAKSLVQFALPDILTTVMGTCKTSLAPSAFLVRSGPDLIARYRTEGASSWPGAKAAIFKLAGEQGAMLKALPDDAIKPLVGAGISGALGNSIKPKSCDAVDRGLAALAPLPLANIADLTTMLMELGAGKNDKSPLKLCPAEQGRPAPVATPTVTSAASPAK